MQSKKGFYCLGDQMNIMDRVALPGGIYNFKENFIDRLNFVANELNLDQELDYSLIL